MNSATPSKRSPWVPKYVDPEEWATLADQLHDGSAAPAAARRAVSAGLGISGEWRDYNDIRRRFHQRADVVSSIEFLRRARQEGETALLEAYLANRRIIVQSAASHLAHLDRDAVDLSGAAATISGEIRALIAYDAAVTPFSASRHAILSCPAGVVRRVLMMLADLNSPTRLREFDVALSEEATIHEIALACARLLVEGHHKNATSLLRYLADQGALRLSGAAFQQSVPSPYGNDADTLGVYISYLRASLFPWHSATAAFSFAMQQAHLDNTLQRLPISEVIELGAFLPVVLDVTSLKHPCCHYTGLDQNPILGVMADALFPHRKFEFSVTDIRSIQRTTPDMTVLTHSRTATCIPAEGISEIYRSNFDVICGVEPYTFSSMYNGYPPLGERTTFREVMNAHDYGEILRSSGFKDIKLQIYSPSWLCSINDRLMQLAVLIHGAR